MDITFTEKITRDPVRLMEQLNQLSLGVEGLGKPVKQIQQQITILSSTVSGALKVNVEDNSGVIIGTQPTIQILNSTTPALTWTITDDPSNTRVKILPVLTTSPALAAIVVGTGRQLTINGTANRITSSAGAQDLSADRTWAIDIAATYVGQSSITTLGTITAGVWNGTTIAIANGGTGQTTANAALNALLPNQATHAGEFLTTDGANTSWAVVSGGSPHNLLSATHSDTLTDSVVLGDIVHGNATPKWARLAGNITTTKMFLTQTGTGAISAAPAWGTILAADIGSGANLSVGTSLQFTAGTGTGVLLAAATVDTIQDIRITAAPQWTRLGIGAAASATNLLTFTQPASSGATGISAMVLTGGAHTTLTNAEAIDVNFNLARTVQFAGNVTLAEQRAVVISGVTYTSDTATKIITDMATFCIDMCTPSTNITATRNHGLWVRDAGATPQDTLVTIDSRMSGNPAVLVLNESAGSTQVAVRFQEGYVSKGIISWDGVFNIIGVGNQQININTNSVDRLTISGTGTVSIPGLTHCIANFDAGGAMSEISHVALGSVLVSQTTTTAPVWSSTPQLSRLGLGAAADANHLLLLSSGTITTDKHQIDGAITWNNAATNFTGWKLNVTNTASGGGSLLLDLQVGGVTKFHVNPSGGVVLGTDLYMTGNGTFAMPTKTANSLLYGDANNELQNIAHVADGSVLSSKGTTATPAYRSLLGTTNQVTVTTNAGNFTLSLPQDIHTSATPQFLRLGLGQAADSSAKMAATGQYFSTAFTLTDGATIALDWNNGNVQKVTLAGNRTFTFANPKAGARYLLVIIQDATGSRTLTWPTIKWSGGSAPTLTTTANKADVITLIYDGSSYYGIASLNF